VVHQRHDLEDNAVPNRQPVQLLSVTAGQDEAQVEQPHFVHIAEAPG